MADHLAAPRDGPAVYGPGKVEDRCAFKRGSGRSTRRAANSAWAKAAFAPAISRPAIKTVGWREFVWKLWPPGGGREIVDVQVLVVPDDGVRGGVGQGGDVTPSRPSQTCHQARGEHPS